MEVTHARLDEAGLHQPHEEPADEARRARPRLDPAVLAYCMGPAALPFVLVLEHFGVVAQHTVWTWCAVFLLMPMASAVANKACERRQSAVRRQCRMAVHAATITAVIYLTGWGPVLIPAYALGALQTFSQDGSRVWKSALGWSLLGVGVGQVLIRLQIAPTFLGPRNAQAVAIMSTFILAFIVRMAAAIVEKREAAERSVQMSRRSLQQSEERFRSLVQHSTDTTLVVAADARISYASPAAQGLLEMRPEELIGENVMSFVHPDDVDPVAAQLHADLLVSDVSRQVEVKLLGRDGRIKDVEAVVTDLLEEPAVRGWVVNMRDITDRKAAEALLVHQARHDG
ncbi:MAG TPA: PAS domain S-box protein, partial [Acidimicrobiales bacterium]|nr:PAS domain S-box protein [Acidimicrobiales bacterium]